MPNRSYFPVSLILIILGVVYMLSVSSCANIIPPGGGPRDSLAPVLVNATPKDSMRHFTGNKITLYFNEYVNVENVQEHLIVSPNPKIQPVVESHLRTVTVRLKDSLQPNTTYSINFGGAIKDVNEGNIAKEFTYVFTTGSTLDSCHLEGDVFLAETGKIDTTLIVVLHRNLDDTAVTKLKPNYYAKLNGRGHFRFNNLPAAKFAVYAIPNDYNKRHDDSTRLFAFLDSSVTSSTSPPAIELHAFQEYREKPKEQRTNNTSGNKKKDKDKEKEEDKRLKVTGTSLSGGEQDLLTPLYIGFNRKLRSFDTSQIILTDTSYIPIAVQPHFSWADTSFTKIVLNYPWKAGMLFKLLIHKEAATDSTGTNIYKADTIAIATKKESAYGSVRLHFENIDFAKNPMLLLVQSDKIVDSFPIRQKQWFRQLYQPGDYELRILYDKDGNGVWSPGRFWESAEKEQPELVFPAKPAKITVRGNWDNEWDITVGNPLEAPDAGNKKPGGQRPPIR